MSGSARPTPDRTAPVRQRGGSTKVKRLDNEGIIPVLARAVREVEQAAERGKVMPHGRATFQVVALLVREERSRINADTEIAEGRKGEQLKRLDGIATILAKTAARDTSLLQLLAEDAEVSDGARALRRQMLKQAGIDAPEEVEPPKPETDRDLVAAPRRAPVGHRPPARQPVPRAGLLGRRAQPGPRPADWPTGSSSSPSSSPSSTSAAGRPPA